MKHKLDTYPAIAVPDETAVETLTAFFYPIAVELQKRIKLDIATGPTESCV